MKLNNLKTISVRKSNSHNFSGVRLSSREVARLSIRDDSLGGGKFRKMLIVSLSYETIKKLDWNKNERIEVMHILNARGDQSDFLALKKSGADHGSKIECKSSTSGGRIRITFQDGMEPENLESHSMEGCDIIFTECNSLIIPRKPNPDKSVISSYQ